MPTEVLGLGEFLYKYMRRWKNNIAQHVSDTDYSETYGQLLQRCIRTSLKLQDTGITKNDVVSICANNDENTCVPFIASQMIGAKTAILHPKLSVKIITHLIKLVEPKIIFVSTDVEDVIEGIVKDAGTKTRIVVFGLSQHHEEFCKYIMEQGNEDKFVPVPNNMEDIAHIAFTSGSTGYPKGVCITHYSLLRLRPCKLAESCNCMLYSTLYWLSGVATLIRSTILGLPKVLCSNSDAIETWQAVRKYKVDYLVVPPSLARELINTMQGKKDGSSLRVLIILGDKVNFNLLEEVTSALPNTTVMNFYGQTEFGSSCFLPNVIKREDVLKRRSKALSCGKVAPHCEWKIVDPTTEQKLGPNKEGELRLKSNSIVTGYYKADPLSIFDSEGYIKTGDLFYYDEEDCMYITGRIKSVFKYRGWHVSPTVIEEVLMNHPAVEDAVVINVPNEADDNHPKGFVKLRKGCENISLKEIEEFVADNVADHEKLRGGVEVVRDIPLTVTGKKNRDFFRQYVSSRFV